MIPAAAANQNQITVLLRVEADQQSAAAARAVARQVQELHTSVIKDLERKRREAAGAAGIAAAAGIGAVAAVPLAITAATVSVAAAGVMITNAGGGRDKVSEQFRQTGLFEPTSFLGWALSMDMGSLSDDPNASPRLLALEAQERTRRMDPSRRTNTKAEQEARFAEEISLQGELRGSLFDMELRKAGAAARGSLVGSAADLADIQAQRGVADAALQERQAREGVLEQGGRIAQDGIRRNITQGDVTQAQADTTAALEKAISLREQERSIVEQIRQTRLSGLDDEINKLQQSKREQESILAGMKQGLQSAVERFATADSGTQRSVLEAAADFDAGKELTAEQARTLSSSGFFEGDKRLQSEFERIATAQGAGELIEAKGTAITEQEKVIAEIQGNIEATNNIKIEFVRNSDEQLKQITEQMMPLIAESEERQVAKFRELLRQAQFHQAGQRNTLLQ